LRRLLRSCALTLVFAVVVDLITFLAAFIYALAMTLFFLSRIASFVALAVRLS
jgi:hypothetical protein